MFLFVFYCPGYRDTLKPIWPRFLPGKKGVLDTQGQQYVHVNI